MRYSFAAKAALAALFVALLALSLSFKVVVYRERAAADPVALPVALAKLLREEQFTARIVTVGRKSGAAVLAERGNCRLLVGLYEADGKFSDLWFVAARPVGRLRFVYDGKVYDRPPGRSALFGQYLTRLMTRLGLTRVGPALLAVAAGPECEVEELPWDRVGQSGA